MAPDGGEERHPVEVVEVGPPIVVADRPSRVEERPVAGRLFSEAFVRAGLAFTFVIIFAVTIGWAFVNVGGEAWANTGQLLELLLPADTALLGSAVGFYFGSRKES